MLQSIYRVECKIKLLETFIIGACGCKDPYLLPYLEFYDPATWNNSTTPHCYTQNQWNCANNATLAFLQDPSQIQDCRIRCTDTTFPKEQSFAYYPPPSSADFFREKLITYLSGQFRQPASYYSFIDNNYFSSNYLQFNVYYQRLNYELYQEQAAVTSVDLLSSIGGNAGLFLGFSLLTFMEFVEYFVVVVMWYFQRKVPVHPSSTSSHMRAVQLEISSSSHELTETRI